MEDKTTWDWQTPQKTIPFNNWSQKFNWVQEPCVSPDGEKIAAIVNIDEMEFNICMNGDLWPQTVEKAWALNFSPDGRLAALVSSDEEWTVCLDGKCWETWFDFIWGLQFTPDGSCIGAAIQKDMEYGMAVNDVMWEKLYHNITGMVLSDQGQSAAVVQVDPMAQADIAAFNSGIFSAAVNGVACTQKHMGIKDICFDQAGQTIAYSIRTGRTGYSVSNNHTPWQSDFQFAWGPQFTDAGRHVIAPVRKGGKWFLYKDDAPSWNRPFEQLWKICVHDQTRNIAAVVSDAFGKWTICENDTLLEFQCDTMIRELFYSDDGSLLVAVFKDKGFWDIAVSGKKWKLQADKLWAPVISSSKEILAARMEKDHRFYLVVNGKIYPEDFDIIFEPEISPDNDKILLKAIKNGIYTRQIVPVDRIV